MHEEQRLNNVKQIIYTVIINRSENIITRFLYF